MNGLVNRRLIMEAWTFLRENNHTIPDETLDFMRDVSLKAIKELEHKERMNKRSTCPFCGGTKITPFVSSSSSQHCTSCDEDGKISNKWLYDHALDEYIKED